ncbi:hypothetical protein GRI39_03135 [Altererythrobacter indicus]|uniref:Uncharacterized protein n=1 Tax=Altericroceibacterium indicum TaxID=374177 RepID=A0A845A439_9SPHN|nr:hypothetical protein [Altericroceibacterium indicum]MXP25042.1 hypothetical protein [Altericroceibacterium indicum]
MSAMPFTDDMPQKMGCMERLGKADGMCHHALPACAGLALALRSLGHAPLLAITKRANEPA